jgi:hypothetical protein
MRGDRFDRRVNFEDAPLRRMTVERKDPNVIHSVRIKNYKSLLDVTIDPGRLTVFVGANGSGKTSVLEAIRDWAMCNVGGADTVFSGDRHPDWLYTRGGNGKLLIRCDLTSSGCILEGTPPEGYPPAPDEMAKRPWSFVAVQYGPLTPSSIEEARGVAFFRLDAALLAAPSYSDHSPPRMDVTGKGLASVLASMALSEPDGFHDLLGTARSLIPRLRRLRFRKEAVFNTEKELVRFGNDTFERAISRAYQGDMILFDFEHAENVAARLASEGTMLMLGLLTLLLGPTRQLTLLLDDIDHGLHPLAQMQLIAVINQVLDRFPNLQVLATAHSPYLLNYLTPDQVRIMAADPDGNALCGKLSDHPKFETWKEEMAPGELWSLFGENWLAEMGTKS